MANSKIFICDDAQAVRLPKAFEFPVGVTDVVIRRVGETLVISPAKALWDDFFDAPGIDLGERVQPSGQEREEF